MARGRSTEDSSMLQMALIGYQVEKQKIEEKIQQINAQLRGKKGSSPSAARGETGRCQTDAQSGGPETYRRRAKETMGRTSPYESPGKRGRLIPIKTVRDLADRSFSRHYPIRERKQPSYKLPERTVYHV